VTTQNKDTRQTNAIYEIGALVNALLSFFLISSLRLRPPQVAKVKRGNQKPAFPSEPEPLRQKGTSQRT